MLTFLITSGPTREYIDPVRFISNSSSGMMGCALAEAAKKLKHKVIFISGPAAVKPPSGIKNVDVVSAIEMFKEVKKYINKADIIIGAAAVADYMPAEIQKHKIKKNAGNKILELKLIPNPDIMCYVGQNKEEKISVGFALESKNLLLSAKNKLKDKNMDLIIANSPAAIGRKKSSVMIIDKYDKMIVIKNKSKEKLAERIIYEALKLWENNQTYKSIRRRRKKLGA